MEPHLLGDRAVFRILQKKKKEAYVILSKKKWQKLRGREFRLITVTE